ncbi:MAG: hypothetical protein E6J77_12975 [Deltaproteobacteria bacterium]|nr:MAG: hypothetical protein E6J77_12975 [Deltaproteobacteria bacterium]
MDTRGQPISRGHSSRRSAISRSSRRDKIRSAFKRALRAARLPEHFTPHSLRHSYASILIAEGVSPAYVQRQLGHSTYTLTVDTYGKWLPMGSKDVDRLDGPSGSKVVATAIGGSGDGGEDNSQVCELPSSSARPSSPSTPRGAATSGCRSSTCSASGRRASTRTGWSSSGDRRARRAPRRSSPASPPTSRHLVCGSG